MKSPPPKKPDSLFSRNFSLKTLAILAGVFLFSSAPRADETDPSIENQGAGEIHLRKDPRASLPESADLHFSYGSLKSEELDDPKLLETIRTVTPPATEENPTIVDVYAEDTPEGKAAGKRLVERVRKLYARALGPKHPVDVDVVALPTEIAKPLAEKDSWLRLSKGEIKTGLIVGALDGVGVAGLWFATGVSPLSATGLGLAQFLNTSLNAMGSYKASNLLNLPGKNGTPPKPGIVFLRRQFLSLLVLEVTRAVASKTPDGYSPLDTVQGQVELIGLNLAMGGLDALIQGARDQRFLGDRAKYLKIFLLTNVILNPLQAMETIGNSPVIWDLTIYQVRASTFAMLAAYGGLTYGITRHPDRMLGTVDYLRSLPGEFVGRVLRAANLGCEALLSSSERIAKRFRTNQTRSPSPE